MSGDEAHWIDSTDLARIAERPARFEQLLGRIAPDDARDGLLAIIADARRHLASFPASCAARERREAAFAELYDLMARAFETTGAEVDRLYRSEEDYILAELDYSSSRTCCWNSTTTAMHQIIVDQAARERADAEADGVCRPPTVFMSQADGYERWRRLAMDTGRAALWLAWSEDEPCPQASATVDRDAQHAWTPYCAWRDGGGEGGGECTDAQEPNQSQMGARSLAPGTLAGLMICSGDSDWFATPEGRRVTIRFRHADGDLDLASFGADGTQANLSQGVGDSEAVVVWPGGAVRIFGYQGATGAYELEFE